MAEPPNMAPHPPSYDAHFHVGLGQAKRTQFADIAQDIRATFASCRARGLTSLRDGGDRAGYSAIARRFAVECGIDYRSPIYALYKRGFYGALIGQPLPGDVAGGGSFRSCFDAAFDALIAKSPDHLKIPLTGTVPLDPAKPIGATAFDRAELAYMIARARDAGLPVMIHANGTDAVRMAAELGATSVEHGYRAGSAGLMAMAEHGCVWVPTIAPFGNLYRDKPPAYTPWLPQIERIYREQLEQLAYAASIGVRIAVGSDAGAPCVAHDTGSTDERAHFALAGLSEPTIARLSDDGYRAIFSRT